MRRFKLRIWWILAAILVLALALRVINLGGRTLWYDESFAVLFSEQGFDAMLDGTVSEAEGAAADVHPLLYYTLLDGWMELFGQGPATVRLLGVLLGTATVGVVYLLARDWFDDERTALGAALITAVAPFHVQYSQEARMYALMSLVLALTTWVYWRAYQRGGWGYWVAFGVLAGISMYTQQLAGFYLLALGLLPFLARDRNRSLQTVAAAGLAVLIYAPWLRYLADQMGKLKQYWVQRPNVLHFWLTLRSFTSVNLDFAAAWWLPTFLLAAVLVVFLLLRVVPVLRAKHPTHPDREPVLWAVWLAFMPMVLMWIASYLFQPVYLPRALLPSALPFFVAMAWLFTRGGLPGPITGVLASAWAAIMVFGLVTLYTWDTFPSPPFDAAIDYLAVESGDTDVIVHGNKITALPMRYYARIEGAAQLDQRYVRDIPGSGSDTLAVPTQDTLGWWAAACPAEAVAAAPRVWYVAFEQFEDEMRELAEDDSSNARYDTLDWLRNHYQETESVAFNDLRVYLFLTDDPGAISAGCGE